ncbi:MAG: sulfatase-like hydrolase/transferase [Luteolibacter sp.]
MHIPSPHIFFLASALFTSQLFSNPVTSSWLTEYSGQYARIYPTTADETAVAPVTTWDHPTGNDQLLPAYAGVTEISTTATDLYIRTSGLPFHTMGPWYGENGNLFPNYPGNIAQPASIPLTPVIQALPKTQTGGGAIGYFIDGVAMFDSRDTFSYIFATTSDAGPSTTPERGDGNWNRDAYVNESDTFDPAFAHQAGATHHYHANPFGLRSLLGDSVAYDSQTNTYTETPNGTHSPILAWVFDGLPVYGPYGYDNPLDPTSGVRRMISGYQKRDGTNGSTNLATTGRQSLPAWIPRNESHLTAPTRTNPLSANQYGPVASTNYPLGHYLEDYTYKGDLTGFTQYDGTGTFSESTHFDLNEYNVRWCVTPEFPEGTYAYFSCIATDGTPVFPYNIGRYYYGTKQGQNVSDLPDDREIIFEGGPAAPQIFDAPSLDSTTGDVTLTWTGVEGGTYRIDRSEDLENWKLLNDSATPTAGYHGENPDEIRATIDPKQFYRGSLTTIASFDENGIDYTAPVDPTFTATFSTLPDLTEITSVTVNGITATIIDSSENTLDLSFDDTSLATGNYTATITHSGGTTTSTNTFEVPAPRNILLLILDDWGIDSSPVDNSTAENPAATFPDMPHLQALAASGIRFTNAYAQPLCSPTRASIITGRNPTRHGVGDPTLAGSFAASELTLPEIFTAQSSAYALASFGKWHLGGGTDGPSTLGGWPEFRGIISGGVQDYYSWDKTINGTTTVSTTYTTTDQVNDTVDFITAQGINPWFAWVAFNAPHAPFHNPPASLHSYSSYPVDTDNEITTPADRRPAYEASLQALDTEIGRLLASVDLSTTNIILIGDNGTPGQVIQDPYSNDHSKGSLYEGGVHVPLVITGPDVSLTGTSSRLVHCVDLFSTILELAKIDVPTATSSVDVIDSQSLLPILKGRDTATRYIISETFTDPATAADGRTIISAAHPEYKLIVFGDPSTATDTPTYEMYRISTDENEQTPLTIPPALGDAHYTAYQTLIAKENELTPPAPAVTLYLQIDSTVTGPGSVPQDISLEPDSITVDGITATFIDRLDTDDNEDIDWIKCTLPADSSPYTSATIDFPDRTANDITYSRIFTTTNITPAP